MTYVCKKKKGYNNKYNQIWNQRKKCFCLFIWYNIQHQNMSKKIANICSDKLKYMLLNCAAHAVKGAINPEMYFRGRVRLFQSMHRFHTCGKKADVKVDHLYVIPYARYYTLREMLISIGVEENCDEDDELLKREFRKMMSDCDHISEQALENAFFDQIKKLKSPDIYEKYVNLNKRINGKQLNEDEKLTFIEATSETDIFIVKKLGKDAEKFMSQEERAVEFMRDYSFVNGWITAGGITVLSLFSALLWGHFPA